MSTRLTDVASRVPFSWEDRLPWLELDFPIAEYEARWHASSRLEAATGSTRCSLRRPGQREQHPLRQRVLRRSGATASCSSGARARRSCSRTPSSTASRCTRTSRRPGSRDVRRVLHRHSTATPVSLVDLAADALGDWGVCGGPARPRRHPRRPGADRPRAAAEAPARGAGRRLRGHPAPARHQEPRRDRDDAAARRGQHRRHGRGPRRGAPRRDRGPRGGRGARGLHRGRHGAHDPVGLHGARRPAQLHEERLAAHRPPHRARRARGRSTSAAGSAATRPTCRATSSPARRRRRSRACSTPASRRRRPGSRRRGPASRCARCSTR